MALKGISSVLVEKHSSSIVVEYTPHDNLGTGLSGWGDMVRELWDSRELTWRMWYRDFSARYRQSILGYVWAVVPSIVMVATFSWLSRARVLSLDRTTLPYPLFLLLGTTVWQLFAGGLIGATGSLAASGSLITKINFPRETLVIAAFGQSVFDFLVRAVLVAVAFAVYRVTPHWQIVFVPLIVIPLALFTMGLGYVLALANGVLRDVGQAVTFILTFWMFLTPVIYPPATTGLKAVLNYANPISPYVIAAQDLVSIGHLSQARNYGVACVVSVLVFAFGWRIFHLAETRIAERI